MSQNTWDSSEQLFFAPCPHVKCTEWPKSHFIQRNLESTLIWSSFEQVQRSVDVFLFVTKILSKTLLSLTEEKIQKFSLVKTHREVAHSVDWRHNWQLLCFLCRKMSSPLRQEVIHLYKNVSFFCLLSWVWAFNATAGVGSDCTCPSNNQDLNNLKSWRLFRFAIIAHTVLPPKHFQSKCSFSVAGSSFNKGQHHL